MLLSFVEPTLKIIIYVVSRQLILQFINSVDKDNTIKSIQEELCDKLRKEVWFFIGGKDIH